MITMESTGDFRNSIEYLNSLKSRKYASILSKYAEIGLKSLIESTPEDSGDTAHSWSYQINETDNGFEISWSNSNIHEGSNIAILIQYGHGTGTGGYVEGIDYINPALKPVFSGILADITKAVNNVK